MTAQRTRLRECEARRPPERRLAPRIFSGLGLAILALLLGATPPLAAQEAPTLEALEGRLAEAMELVADEQFELAGEWFERLIGHCPSVAELHHDLAVTLAARGRYAEAAEVLRAAPALPDPSRELLVTLGDLLGLSAERPQLVADTVRLELLGVDLGGCPADADAVPGVADADVPRMAPDDEIGVEIGSEMGGEMNGTEAAPEPSQSSREDAGAATRTGRLSELDRIASARLEDSVRRTVASWADAWASQDVEAYLSHYSGDFEPPGGVPRAAWEAQRRDRILGKASIDVEVAIERVSVAPDGALATAVFQQAYASDSYSDRGTTTLELAREDRDWKIVRQRFEPSP